MTKLDLQPVIDQPELDLRPVVDEIETEPYGYRVAPTVDEPGNVDSQSEQNLEIADSLEIPLTHAEEISNVTTLNGQKYKRPNIYKRALFGLANKVIVQPIKNMLKKGKARQMNTHLEVLTKLNKIKEEEGRDVSNKEFIALYSKTKEKQEKEIQAKLPHLQLPGAEGALEKAVEIELSLLLPNIL